MTAMQKDIGSRILTVGCLNPIVLNSSVGSEDNTEQNGFTVDRELLNPGQPLALSGQAALIYSYALATAKTCAVTMNLQHSSAASSWTDFNDINGSTGQSRTLGTTASTAAQTGNGTLRANFDFSGAKRYLRMQYKFNFSATATDDADVGGVIVLGGYDTVPASTAGV